MELEDLDHGLVNDDARVRPTLADDPRLLASLGDLDCGLVDGNTDLFVQPPPPLMDRLVIPAGRKRERLVQPGPANVIEPDEMAGHGHVSTRTAAFALILAMCLGATSAAFVFHERLSQIVVQWQAAHK